MGLDVHSADPISETFELLDKVAADEPSGSAYQGFFQGCGSVLSAAFMSGSDNSNPEPSFFHQYTS
jgi:hypothetical protein